MSRFMRRLSIHLDAAKIGVSPIEEKARFPITESLPYSNNPAKFCVRGHCSAASSFFSDCLLPIHSNRDTVDVDGD